MLTLLDPLCRVTISLREKKREKERERERERERENRGQEERNYERMKRKSWLLRKKQREKKVKQWNE